MAAGSFAMNMIISNKYNYTNKMLFFYLIFGAVSGEQEKQRREKKLMQSKRYIKLSNSWPLILNCAYHLTVDVFLFVLFVRSPVEKNLNRYSNKTISVNCYYTTYHYYAGETVKRSKFFFAFSFREITECAAKHSIEIVCLLIALLF